MIFGNLVEILLYFVTAGFGFFARHVIFLWSCQSEVPNFGQEMMFGVL